MTKTIDIESLKCLCVQEKTSRKVTYIIYPAIEPFKDEWLQEKAASHKTNLVVVYIPAEGWNDMLTPWPEPGETHDSPPFAGNASETLSLIQDKVIPACEKVLEITGKVERDIIGVSLSGLFSLWQWIQCDTFDSIASLSGSFWYPNFIEWFEKQNIPSKSGKAYFLLGEKEPKAWIKAYRSVGINTETIVEILKGKGLNVAFQWVPGDHFADPAGRLEDAFKALD